MKFNRVMAKNQCTFLVVGNDLFLAAVENTQINLDDDTVVYAVESSTSRPWWTGTTTTRKTRRETPKGSARNQESWVEGV